MKPFAILAIDQGNTSGWSLWSGPDFQMSGRVEFARRGSVRVMADVADTFVALRERLGEGVVVFEDHAAVSHVGKSSRKALLGMGAARGRWESLIAAGGSFRQVSVAPDTWRPVVLGTRRRLQRDKWKELAVTWARAMFKAEVEDDEAEAVCIGLWATTAPEVRAVLPKKWRTDGQEEQGPPRRAAGTDRQEG